jgi:hypothetical protein
LVTGATGYVGGRLVPRLLERGHQVRVLVRDEARLQGRPWAGRVEVVRGSLEDREGLIREVRVLHAKASPEALFRSFSSLGGERGWLAWNWAWVLRGLLDRMVGGPGLRRGRRHPTELLPGEAVDFWRVEAADPPRLLRLRAEMRLPGRAWLEWEAREEKGGSLLVQTAYFEPKGLTGFLYWWALYPIHRRIFSDLARAIVREAEAAQAKAPWSGGGAG